MRIFKRKKKKKDEQLSIFGEPIVETPKENKGSFKSYVTGGLRRFRRKTGKTAPQRKIRFKYLLKIKRVFAGLLCIMYLLSFLTSIPQYAAILFFATFFFLLDYLWKTRRVKWVKETDS